MYLGCSGLPTAYSADIIYLVVVSYYVVSLSMVVAVLLSVVHTVLHLL